MTRPTNTTKQSREPICSCARAPYAPHADTCTISIVEHARKCESCGEPEEGGDFGWFDTDTEGLVCQGCGADPIATKGRTR